MRIAISSNRNNGQPDPSVRVPPSSSYRVPRAATELSTGSHQKSSGYKVVCQFTNWASYRRGEASFKPKDIDADLCTHVLYSYALLDDDELVMKVRDPAADLRQEFYSQVAALKAKGVRVSIALGGWNESGGGKFSRLVNDEKARKYFVESAVDFLDLHAFDGLHFDWSYPTCWQVLHLKNPYSNE